MRLIRYIVGQDTALLAEHVAEAVVPHHMLDRLIVAVARVAN